MTDLTKTNPERLFILLSGFPNCREGKLINVSTLASGKGVNIADEIYAKLSQFNLTEHM